MLDLQEDNFLNLIKKISGYDLFVRETIKMVEAKDFLLLTEAQAQTLVDLKNNLQVEKLMKFIAAPITPERSNYNFQ